MSSVGEEERLHVEEEYGIQLHGCSPLIVQTRVVETMKSVVNEAVVALTGKIAKLIPKCDHKAVFAQIKSEYFSAVDTYHPQLLAAIRESLKIPQGLLLPEDTVQAQQYSEEESKDIKNETALLKKRLIYNQALNNVLQSEIQVLNYFNTTKENVEQYQEFYKTYKKELELVRRKLSELQSLD